MSEDEFFKKADKQLYNKKELMQEVKMSPMKLWQTKRALCRKCIRMVARNIEQGTPELNEDKTSYCDSCARRLEKIWG